MVAVMLLLIAGGIGLAQAASDPHQVTLRWLRLGGIIVLSLIAVAGTMAMMADHEGWQVYLVLSVVAMIPSALQLLFVQLARRTGQRVCALMGWLVCAGIAVWFVGSVFALNEVMDNAGVEPDAIQWRYPDFFRATSVSFPIAAGLTGGFLMTMLLGHAYLTAGSEMTQKPFARLVKVLAVLLVLRAVASLVFGLWPYMSLEVPRSQQMWNTLMVTTRYGVGLVVPAVFTYMIWDCVKRRANQSATGILYVATVLVMIGEGIALGLIGETGVVF